MVHYPFLWVFFSYVEVKKPSMSELVMVIPISTLLLIVLAYFMMVYVDVPIRNHLKNRVRKRLILAR